MAIIKRRIQAQMSGGNFEATQKAAQAGNKIQQFLATIDKSEDLDLNDPQEIILTRQGESAKLNPAVLLNGAVSPLEAGDVVEIH